jgi:hypothetical protein
MTQRTLGLVVILAVSASPPVLAAAGLAAGQSGGQFVELLAALAIDSDPGKLAGPGFVRLRENG